MWGPGCDSQCGDAVPAYAQRFKYTHTGRINGINKLRGLRGLELLLDVQSLEEEESGSAVTGHRARCPHLRAP